MDGWMNRQFWLQTLVTKTKNKKKHARMHAGNTDIHSQMLGLGHDFGRYRWLGRDGFLHAGKLATADEETEEEKVRASANGINKGHVHANK